METRSLAEALAQGSPPVGALDGQPDAASRPDVVVLHLDLLPTNGADGATLPTDTPAALPLLPVVLVGEDEDDPRAAAGLAAGAQDYVTLQQMTPARLRRVLGNACMRHRLLQNVAASDAHFRMLADSAPVLIWVADTERGCVYFNRAWLDFTGRSMEQELGFGWSEGVHHDDRARCMQTYDEAFAARRPFAMEYRLRNAQGRYRWVLNHGAPRFSPDGAFVGFSGGCTDITERRLAEEELRDSEGRLRELAALLPQIIWVGDSSGETEYVNERWIEYTGLSAQQSLMGGARRVIHPDDLHRVLAAWTAALQAGTPYEAEMQLRAADGSYAWFLVRSLPVRNADGEVIKWFGTSTNIDTRKRAELVDATLARLIEQLRQLDQPDSVAETLVTALADELRLEVCSYSEVDWGAGGATIHAYRQDGRLLSAHTLPLAEVIWPITAAQIVAGRAVAIADLAADPRSAAAYAAGKTPPGLRSAVAVPAKSGDRGVGLLVAGMHAPRSWTADEIELLERLALPARLALEKARAEQSLRVSERRFRLALNDSRITVSSIDQELRYTWVYNPPPGFSVEMLIGRRDDEVLPPDVAEPWMAFKREALAQGGALRRELEWTLGHFYSRYDVTAEPLEDDEGRALGVIIVAVDITERTRADERLAFLAEASKTLSSSLVYEEALQRVSAAMVPHMADWCAVDLLTPQGAVELMAVAHIDPAKIAWAHALRRRFPPSMDDPAGLAHVIRTGASEFYPEIDLEALIEQATDEEVRQVLREVGYKSVILAPLTARGQTFGALTLVWSDSDRRYDEADLTFAEELARRAAVAIDNARLYQEARAAEADLRALNETLEQHVVERTAELVRSNQELDQFAYVASHDLKAPLRAIDHLATWIDEDAGHLLPDRSREHLAKMRGRIQRMEGLLDDLLAYSRAGRHQGETAPVALQDLVEQVLETMAVADSFQVRIGDAMPTITTLRVPLETVLRNLLGNAVKHHDKPNGLLEIDAWSLGDGMVEFVVRDDGPGIDPVYHERIFQMFQTLLPRDQREGSGIGLAVVKKIVESVGGRVWVESQAGEGAVFRFTWPEQMAA
ncbi:MAG: PAS domain S-box protein [Caldilineaceae bacterium]|nr:PAS domain S-box protein [Caldilineaceae bacterium]